MLLSFKRYIKPLQWLPICFLFVIASPAMASEYQNVDVRLAGINQARYELLTGEAFTMDVTATVFCTWRNVKSSLKFYAIREEELGHIFELNSNLDYAAIRRDGDLLLRTRKYSFDCDEGLTVSAGLQAPLEPAIYYVSACLPTLRDEDGEVYANTGTGNWFSCSAPLVLNVEPRPEPDLIVLGNPRVRPSKAEYQPSETVTMRVVVRNIGDGDSRPTQVRLRASAFPTNDQSHDVATLAVPALSPGERVVKQFQVTTPNQARTTYYTGCVDGVSWSVITSVGTYIGGEQRHDNNCSYPMEIKTTNSRLPSIYVERLRVRSGTFAPSTPLFLIADIRNGETSRFKGGEVVYRKKLPLFRRLSTNADRMIRPVLSRFTKGEEVYKNGILLEAGATTGHRVELETPSSPGRYRYTMCLSHGREVFGCGATVEVIVR